MNLADLRAHYVDRIRLARWLLVPILVLGVLLRVLLYVAFHDGPFLPSSLLLALGAGFLYDLCATSFVLAIPFALLATLRLRLLEDGFVRFLLLALFYSALFFDAAVEYCYFEEFNARYNHIALDYLLYPTEVFTNIGESYNVPLVAGLSLLLGVSLALYASSQLRDVEFGSLPWAARWRALGAVAVRVVLSGAAYSVLPAQVSEDRITSEVADNGPAQLVRAFLTSDLDYRAYYRTMPRAEARARAAKVLGFPAPSAADLAAPEGAFSLRKEIRSRPGPRDGPWDAVVILEESLGSSFVGSLGARANACTPELDRWSKEGLFLANLVANGNRTVRGLEGVLCSFVPLPGDSVVKRTRQPEVACVADVFEARGFATCFLYGGFGIFDRMKTFALKNGYQEFVEQPDFPRDAFRTAWGVADEYIFDALLDRQERAASQKRPLFATLLSVSNHKPYAVPPGRTGRPAGEKTRPGAVAYADWCLGRYLDAARKKGILDHTIVLVLGDHGARVYGAQEIPVASYRIPALFLAPDGAFPAPNGAPDGWKGRRIERLCSQIDLAPTLLSLCGIACDTPFLGQDLTALPEGPGRAFVNHDRDIGILTDDALVVLGLRKTVFAYTRSGREDDRFLLVEPARWTPELRELELDATAVFQCADELYRSGRFTMR